LRKQSGFVDDLPSKLLPFIPEVPRSRTDVGKELNPRFAELTQLLAQMDRAPPPVLELPRTPNLGGLGLLAGRGLNFDRGGGEPRGGRRSIGSRAGVSASTSSSSSSGVGGSSGGSAGGTGGGCFARGTPIQMANGEIMNVEELSIGDDTLGGLVTGTMILMPEQMYDYKGTKVSGSQSVQEDKWIHVKDSPLASKIDLFEPIFHFDCEHHLIYIGDVVFADYSYYPVGDTVEDERRFDEHLDEQLASAEKAIEILRHNSLTNGT